MKKIHEFDNAIKVYDEHLLEVQRQRYKIRNVHEQDEEDLFIALVKSLPENAVFVNVGTAIGYYPLLASLLRKDLTIHCFEPLPSHIRQFEENIELNGRRCEDFHIHACAISVESGNVRFIDNSYGSTLVSGSPPKEISALRSLGRKIKSLLKRRPPANEITVQAIPLSGLFDKIGTLHVDLLQMDIQGFEAPVLEAFFGQDARQSGVIKNLLVGTHGEKPHKRCREITMSHGYTIVHDEVQSAYQPDGILICTMKNDLEGSFDPPSSDLTQQHSTSDHES